MKHAKTAALIAGSMVALGAAAPAFAAGSPEGSTAPVSDMAAEGAHAPGNQAAPVEQAPGSAQSGPLDSLGGAANSLSKQRQTNSTPLSQLGRLTDLGGATKGLPLLGGLPLR